MKQYWHNKQIAIQWIFFQKLSFSKLSVTNTNGSNQSIICCLLPTHETEKLSDHITSVAEESTSVCST